MKRSLLVRAFVVFFLSGSLASAQDNDGDGPRFDIASYAVEGNTLLPPARVTSILAPFTGRNRGFATVQKAMQALETAFANAGFTAVQVNLPEQQMRDGKVRLLVDELKLGQVVVEGNRYYDEANVRRALPSLKPGGIPNVDEIARNLRTANESPAKQTKVALKVGEAPGTVDAVAKVSDDRPLRLALTLDTTGTPSTGILRAGAALQHANLFNADQVGSVQVVTSPEQMKDVLIVALGYHVPLYRWGDSLDLAYIRSDVNSGNVSTGGAAGGTFSISGRGDFSVARYNWNLPLRGNLEHKLVFGFDWRDFNNSAFFGGTGPSLIPDITVHPASLGYNARYRNEQQDLSGFLSVLQNIPGGSGGSAADFNASRAGASESYRALRFGASWLRLLPASYQLRLSASGQWTNDMLIAGEQWGVGGIDSVRGFLEREVSNDRGYRVSAEAYTPDLAPALKLPMRTQALVFMDYGYAARNNPQPGEVASETISSTGVGVRMYYGNRASIRLDYSVVMQPGGTQGRGDQRLQGVLAVYF